MGAIPTRAKGRRKKFQELCKAPPTRQNLEALRETVNELMKVEHLNERFWAQRAHHIALKKGDRNAAFFRARVKQRHGKNLIKVLRDKDGELCSGRASIEAIVVDYFEHLFTTSSPEINEQDLSSVRGKVSVEEGEMLVRPFTRAEVEHALKQMAPTKAPGSDGMTGLFFSEVLENSWQ